MCLGNDWPLSSTCVEARLVTGGALAGRESLSQYQRWHYSLINKKNGAQ